MTENSRTELHRLSIYVPTQAHDYRDYITAEDSITALEHVKRTLAQSLGGYTAYNTQGGWVNDEGELVEEPVTVVYSLAADRDLEELEELGEGLALYVRTKLEQECVLYTVDPLISVQFVSAARHE